MNCGICAEVCPFDSIYMDGEYEMATDDRFDGLVLGLDRLAKSADYHMRLRPKEAAAVMEKRRAAEEKKRKAAEARAAKAKAAAEKKAKEAAAKKAGEEEEEKDGKGGGA